MTTHQALNMTQAVRTFPAMNTEVELLCYGPGAERRISRAKQWLQAYENRFSRFRLLSELSRMNSASGRPFRHPLA